MPRKGKFLDFVKVVRAKGHEYLYFDTGAKDARGRIIFKRLPSRGDPTFGTVYAAMKGARTKRQDIEAQATLAEIIKLYHRSEKFRALSDGTQRTYLIYLNQLSDQMGVAPADEFTHVEAFELLDTMKPIAANMMAIVIRHVYAHARKRGKATIDPVKDYEANEGGEYEPWPDELLRDALASDDLNVAIPVALLYYTAQRIGDVCSIRWTDIRDGAIMVTQQKTGKELEIPLHAEARAALARIEHPAVVDLNRTILINAKGKPLSTALVRQRLKDYAKAKGHKIVPHGLRKNAVNALLEAGCSVGETSSISGQSLAMVEHYSKRRNNRTMGKAAILKWEGNR